MRREERLNGKRKGFLGALELFGALGVECKTDAAEREQRVLAHYAEPRGGKALEEGLMQNAKCKIKNYLLSPISYLLSPHS